MNALCRQDRAGFTLVEILVVVAIAAMLSALAVPAFRGGNSEEKVSRNAALILRQYLRSARTYAIENRVKTAICYLHSKRNMDDVDEAKWNGYVMVYEDPDYETWKQLRGGSLQERIVLHHAAYLRPGRFVDRTGAMPAGMMPAFERGMQGIRVPDVKGYSAFRPSGSGTIYDGNEWIPLTGMSEMHVFDERLGENVYLAVRVVNTTGKVKIRREKL